VSAAIAQEHPPELTFALSGRFAALSRLLTGSPSQSHTCSDATGPTHPSPCSTRPHTRRFSPRRIAAAVLEGKSLTSRGKRTHHSATPHTQQHIRSDHRSDTTRTRMGSGAMAGDHTADRFKRRHRPSRNGACVGSFERIFVDDSGRVHADVFDCVFKETYHLVFGTIDWAL
jgi:hypothetical protein